MASLDLSLQLRDARSNRRNLPLWSALLFLVCAGPLFFRLQITHDAAWQIWIGRQMLHGAGLYSEIVEINPPLWFWIAEPLAALGGLLHVSGLDILVAFFLTAIAASVVLMNGLLPNWPKWRRVLFLNAFVLITLLPGNFGQREHFTFISVAPYVLLIACRGSGLAVSPKVAALTGLFAAVGLALKPQFAIAPVVLELCLWKAILRPETGVLGICAIAYVAAILAFEPDYFTTAIPLAQQAYGAFGGLNPVWLVVTTVPFVAAWFVRLERDLLSRTYLAAALTFYLVYILQLKGFAYQLIPAMGMLVLAVASAIPTMSAIRDAIAVAAAILAIRPNLEPYRTPPWADVPRGASYAALSVAPRAAWPLVEERNLKWSLRSMSLWMAPALGDRIRAGVVRDLECNPPNILLVDDRQIQFSRMFPTILSHYVAVKSHQGLTLMKAARPFPIPKGCRKVY